ncbi:MAG: prephenate dehydratase [Gammaproteobacteria bacterium]|nr:prephenate dehydratase [Gammaproteobacteria bacterium]
MDLKENIEEELAVYRKQIDRIDEDILNLMNKRITAAKSIGEIKATLEKPAFYRPEREAQVIRRLKSLNGGPLDDFGVESLYREIMSVTRGMEAGLSVSVLGPKGTYTELAARQHFGSAVGIVYAPDINEIFRSSESGQTNFAVVPVENSTEGGVSATLDRLITTSLLISGEINFKVHHNLLGFGDGLEDIERVYAHSQSLAQCKRWLGENLPGVKVVPVSSNAEAAKKASMDSGAAAIASISAADIYGLRVLSKSIEDEANNTTRFLVLSNQDTPQSGNDKTSLLLSCKHQPGALFRMLKPLFDANVDMTKIESRPSKTGLWEYVFFIDLLGHHDDESIRPALSLLRDQAGLFKNLGSYPVSG